MKKIILSMGISLFVLATVASARGADEGKRLYEQKCRLCHGVNGNGDGPAAAAFSPPPADFATSSFWKDYDQKSIAEIIQEGRGRMPAFHLTSDEVQAIIDYMSQTFKPGQ
jgi:mono/diheme cytochrome c family protein